MLHALLYCPRDAAATTAVDCDVKKRTLESSAHGWERQLPGIVHGRRLGAPTRIIAPICRSFEGRKTTRQKQVDKRRAASSVPLSTCVYGTLEGFSLNTIAAMFHGEKKISGAAFDGRVKLRLHERDVHGVKTEKSMRDKYFSFKA